MAIADRYGLHVTTSSPVAAERFQDGMDRLLSFGAGAQERFAAALLADEGLALAHAGVALIAVAQGDAATARAAAGKAREVVAGATRRERQHVEALSALIAGETARGLALVEEHVTEFPRDALLVNQAGSAIGFAGRSDREQHRMAFLERLAPAYGDDWWFQSALAFTYHEVDRSEESRRLSERSLQQYPGNANASHNRPTSSSRPPTRRRAPRSSETGWPGTTPAHPSIAISPGTRRCSSCTRVTTRARSRSSGATSWAR